MGKGGSWAKGGVKEGRRVREREGGGFKEGREAWGV